MFQTDYTKLKFSKKPVYKFNEFQEEKLSFFIQQGQDEQLIKFQKNFLLQPKIQKFLESNHIYYSSDNSYFNPSQENMEEILSQIQIKSQEMLLLKKPLFVFISYLGEESMLYEQNGHYKQSIRGLVNEIAEQFKNVFLLGLIDIHPTVKYQKTNIFNVYDFLKPETDVKGNINLLFQTFQKSRQDINLENNNIINKFFEHSQQFEGFYLKDFIQEFYMEHDEIQSLQKKGNQYKQLKLSDLYKLSTNIEQALFPDEDLLDKYLYLERGEGTIEIINDLIDGLLEVAELSIQEDLKLQDHQLQNKSRSSSFHQYNNMLSSNQQQQQNGNENNQQEEDQKYNPKIESLASKARGWLGICYLFGRGKIIKNEAYAVQIFQQEIMYFNSGISHLGLGEALYYGVGGLKKNKKQAAKHFKKATQNDSNNNYENDRRAFWRLGELFYWGEGVVKEREEAINYWWQTSADLNYVCANCYLGIDYYMGSHAIDNIDKKKALYLIRKAVKQDYQPAKQFLINSNISQETMNQEADAYIKEYKNNLFSNLQKEQQNKQQQNQQQQQQQQILQNCQQQLDEVISQVD